jgi:transcriptional regulator with XRE-family HTH domain
MTNIFKSRQLRRLRRAFAFTQKELGAILGLRQTSYITKLENGLRKPSHHILARLMIIFGKPAEVFIPDIVQRALESVHENTLLMRKELINKSDKKSQRKLELLDSILNRLSTNQHK